MGLNKYGSLKTMLVVFVAILLGGLVISHQSLPLRQESKENIEKYIPIVDLFDLSSYDPGHHSVTKDCLEYCRNKIKNIDSDQLTREDVRLCDLYEEEFTAVNPESHKKKAYAGLEYMIFRIARLEREIGSYNNPKNANFFLPCFLQLAKHWEILFLDTSLRSLSSNMEIGHERKKLKEIFGREAIWCYREYEIIMSMPE